MTILTTELAALKVALVALEKLGIVQHGGYDWNADPEFLTQVWSESKEIIEQAIARLEADQSHGGLEVKHEKYIRATQALILGIAKCKHLSKSENAELINATDYANELLAEDGRQL